MAGKAVIAAPMWASLTPLWRWSELVICVKNSYVTCSYLVVMEKEYRGNVAASAELGKILI